MPRIDEQALIRELLRREQHATPKARSNGGDRPPPTDYVFLKDLFDRQREFVFDPADHKTLLCSRRAGKTYCATAYLLKECFDVPGVVCVYIGQTRLRAKQLMMKELERFNLRYSLKIAFNKADLTATLPNGSMIIMTGASDASDIDKLRGGKYALVIVDEAQAFGTFFDSLLDEIIEPALVDLQGTLCLLGTPGAAAVGMFYDATTFGATADGAYMEGDENDGFGDNGAARAWKNFSWTMRDNKGLNIDVDLALKRIRQRRGWAEDHPIYRREYLAQWVRSDDDLVYKFQADRNVFQVLPELSKQPWQHVMGIDLGFNDLFTISVLAFNPGSATVYVVDSFGQAGLIPAQWAEHIARYISKYQPVSVVADAGALGKAIVEEMRTRYALPIKAAEKSKKLAYIDLLNGDLVSGRLKFYKGAPAIDEMRRLQWDPDSRRTREDPSYKNDYVDSSLYAWRESRHWLPGAEADDRVNIHTADPFDLEVKLYAAAKARGAQAWWEQDDKIGNSHTREVDLLSDIDDPLGGWGDDN